MPARGQTETGTTAIAILAVPTFDAAAFSYSDKTYVAEASDIGFRQFGQIYDDACDEGIALRRGSDFARFYHDSTDYDASGEEIAGWRFKPIPEDLRRLPKLEGVSVLIIND